MKLTTPDWPRLSAWTLAVVLPLLIISAVIAAAFNFQPLYEYGFSRYNVAEATGLAPAELTKAAHGLTAYFNSGDEFIDLVVVKDGEPFTLFNEREIIHLYDVKALIRLDYLGLDVSLGYSLLVAGLLFYRRQRQLLAAPVFWGGSLTLAVVAALGLAAAIDFNAFFTRFHMISFANDFWLLDPSTDYLIMLFPGGFWQDAVIFLGLGIVIIAAVAAFIGWRSLGRQNIDKNSGD
ncbi:MAG: TIGR01906 family membrane protein [Dehalogenimonas sp.]|jgi:integral membrane protein (TIGR01906 family)|uniref:TIGR01906 family membrane protein n=1 Tax=Candidatus Dehalogenimonas loeffleri TaxID=3127115 RepID=A0ABZ2J5B7_9CHLR|nr:TIGR01906 family membrane protein [Dehalogenimonas sp.]